VAHPRTRRLLVALGVLALATFGVALHARSHQLDDTALGARRAAVRAVGSADLALSSSARWIRHPSQVELAAPSVASSVLFAIAIGLALGLLFAARRAGVPALGFWLGFGGTFVLATLAAQLARGAACTAFGGHGPGGLLLGLVAQGLVLAGLGRLLLARQPKVGPILTPLPRARVYAQSMFYALVGLPRAAVIAFALQGAWLALGRLQTGTPIDSFADAELGVLGSALLLFAGAVLAPYAEEVLFRGALFSHLARVSSPWGTILASAALFGAMHVHHGVSVVGPLVMGVVLGWARARTGGLLVPIALHATFNAASLIAGVILR